VRPRQPPSLYLDHAGNFRKLRERGWLASQNFINSAGRGDDVARQPSGAVGSQETAIRAMSYRLSYAPKRVSAPSAFRNRFQESQVSWMPRFTGPGAIALTRSARAQSLASTRVIAFQRLWSPNKHRIRYRLHTATELRLITLPRQAQIFQCSLVAGSSGTLMLNSRGTRFPSRPRVDDSKTRRY